MSVTAKCCISFSGHDRGLRPCQVRRSHK